MKLGMSPVLLACAVMGIQQTTVAAENATKTTPMSEQEVRQLQQKTQSLIDALVKKGIIDAETARALNAPTASAPEPVDKQSAEPPKGKPIANDSNVVRVPYVSKTVREQIREEVKSDLKKEVVESVMEKARDERWGVPSSWPAWVNKISFKGDVRFRYEMTQFEDDNSPFYYDVLAINKAGGKGPSSVINTTEDNDRLRLRARLNFDVNIAPGWSSGFRLSTGKASNPVSANVTLSNGMSDFELNLTRAFISYQTDSKTLKAWAGRFENPWLGTDLVWDEDLGFGGVAVRYAPWHEDRDQEGFDPFVTLGAFPIDEIALSAHDKWLYGVQTGFNYKWENENTLKLGIAYYDYTNMQGKPNTFGSNLLDYTAPTFAQKGNSLINIRINNDKNSEINALAADYNEGDITLVYDIANFAPTHIILIADAVHNFGQSAKEYKEFINRTRGDLAQVNTADIPVDMDGYKFEVQVGHPVISKHNDWNLAIAYKSLGRDAVLDAYTDSDFHLGGTDGRGYILTGKYGITNNVAVGLRLLSGDSIDALTLGVDTWQFDLNAKF